MKVREIAEFLGAELRGDGEVEILSVAAISDAGPSDLSFHERSESLPKTQAGCVLVKHSLGKGPTHIVVGNPKLAFAKAAAKLLPHERKYKGNSAGDQTAIIADSADVRTVDIGKFVTIGENSYVGEGCKIGDGARIGDNVTLKKYSVIHQNCVIYDNVEIGYDCVIHAGTVIGADGFGYVKDENGNHVKFPQIGTVVIEDSVEIGANCCVDRGSLGETRIGTGTKIDNLVQIAHNVQIGKNCIIVAMSGISGSSVLEDNVVLAGQVGIADHVTIKKGAVVAAKSAVFPNKVVSGGIWAGIPARPISEFNASFAALKKLAKDLRKSTISDRSNGSEQ